ncbi:MAG TPA: DNA repair protein RecN [Bacteroidales bacterium]|nr:DNA repair protein RecN [Bacteroidales bacterium]HRZ49462.1 DNA repair protein RecN [Bacteroidales bacterium]
MLQRLVITNYALIRHLDLSFGAGLSTLTGETGAGKSIMLGALGLVLGNRADTQVLWDKEEKCVVEATFRVQGYQLEEWFSGNDLDYLPETILRREITPAGKSRAFINDTPVTLPLMKEVGSRLVNIHSQHEILLLNNRDFQLAVIDSFAGIEKEVDAYQTLFRDYTRLREKLAAIREEHAAQIAQQDYDMFLLDELRLAELDKVDLQAMEASCRMLEHAGEIRLVLHRLLDLFSNEPVNLISAFRNASESLYRMEAGGKLAQVAERLKSMWLETDDLNREMELLAGEVDDNPEELATIRDRLSQLYHIMQKHRVNDLAGLISIRDTLSEKWLKHNDRGTEISRISAECEIKYQELKDRCAKLSRERAQASKPLAEHLGGILAKLGMPLSAVNFQITPLPEPGADGSDHVELLFSANAGSDPSPVSRVASGGELSRLMLAIKSVLSTRQLIPTIIFDEIDAGVSGEIAGKAGNIMQQMGSSMQVIAITHLPQIAARGAEQFQASKYLENGRTFSVVQKLTPSERIEAIARMLSDGDPTPESLANAHRLMLRDKR